MTGTGVVRGGARNKGIVMTPAPGIGPITPYISAALKRAWAPRDAIRNRAEYSKKAAPV
jgi:hypothetical protein